MREQTLWEKLHARAQEMKPKPIKLRQTKTAKLARERLMRHLEGFTDDAALWWKIQRATPEAWGTLEDDVPVEEPKEKVTLYLDRSVARLYRSMGTGWHARVNRVLATYAQMRMGEVARERREMMEIMTEFGLPVPEQLTDWYLDHPEFFAHMTDRDRSALDTVFGLGTAPRLDKPKDTG